MQVNNSFLFINDPVGSIKNKLKETIWVSLEGIVLIGYANMFMNMMLFSNFSHISLIIFLNSAVDPHSISNTVD